MMYGNVSCKKKKQEYCIKRVNKANLSPSKAVYFAIFIIALHASYMHWIAPFMEEKYSFSVI